MTDERALLAAMAADPADDTVRLAYADLLEENGDVDRAEFVRVQVELARMNPGDPLRRPLVVRNLAFLREFAPALRAQLPQLPGIEWGDFNRGLVEEVQAASEAAIVRYAKVIFAQPAVHVIRLARLGDAQALAKLPELKRVRALRMVSAVAEEDVLRDLLASPHLEKLIVIDLHGNRAGDDTATDIADGRFPALAELWLGANRIGIRGAKALASSLHLGALRFLDLRGNRIDRLATREDLIQRFGKNVKLS
jgi:uncharacterized protein (TIGR02996 family)